MKKIIVIYHLFTKSSKVFVYEDGNEIESETVDFDNINDKILMLCNKYEINQVDLSGPKSFLEHSKKEILSDAIVKYGNNNLVINII